jgi:hypothetical protein
VKRYRSEDLEVTFAARRCPLQWRRGVAFSPSSPRPFFRFRAFYLLLRAIKQAHALPRRSLLRSRVARHPRAHHFAFLPVWGLCSRHTPSTNALLPSATVGT